MKPERLQHIKDVLFTQQTVGSKSFIQITQDEAKEFIDMMERAHSPAASEAVKEKGTANHSTLEEGEQGRKESKLSNSDHWYKCNLQALLGGEITIVEKGIRPSIDRDMIARWTAEKVSIR